MTKVVHLNVTFMYYRSAGTENGKFRQHWHDNSGLGQRFWRTHAHSRSPGDRCPGPSYHRLRGRRNGCSRSTGHGAVAGVFSHPHGGSARLLWDINQMILYTGKYSPCLIFDPFNPPPPHPIISGQNLILGEFFFLLYSKKTKQCHDKFKTAIAKYWACVKGQKKTDSGGENNPEYSKIHVPTKPSHLRFLSKNLIANTGTSISW